MNTKLKDYLFELCAAADRGDKIDYDESCEEITKFVLEESEEAKWIKKIMEMYLYDVDENGEPKAGLSEIVDTWTKAKEILSKYETN